MNNIINLIIEENKKWSNLKYCLEAVKNDWLNLHQVRIQTLEICLAAVNEYCYALQYAKIQTPEICLAAVRQNGALLEYVKYQTPEICAAAIKENLYTYEDVILPKDEKEKEKFIRELGLLLLNL